MMNILADIMVVQAVLLHLCFLVPEIFLWQQPKGLRAVGIKAEFTQEIRSLKATRNLYNEFLAASLAGEFRV